MSILLLHWRIHIVLRRAWEWVLVVLRRAWEWVLVVLRRVPIVLRKALLQIQPSLKVVIVRLMLPEVHLWWLRLLRETGAMVEPAPVLFVVTAHLPILAGGGA